MTSPSTEDVLDEWGRNMARARLTVGLTQHQLAHACGVYDATVKRWEAGSRRPDEEMQARIADALSVTVTSLFPRTLDEAGVVVDDGLAS